MGMCWGRAEAIVLSPYSPFGCSLSYDCLRLSFPPWMLNDRDDSLPAETII